MLICWLELGRPCEPCQAEAQQNCAEPTEVLALWEVASEARFYYAQEIL